MSEHSDSGFSAEAGEKGEKKNVSYVAYAFVSFLAVAIWYARFGEPNSYWIRPATDWGLFKKAFSFIVVPIFAMKLVEWLDQSSSAMTRIARLMAKTLTVVAICSIVFPLLLILLALVLHWTKWCIALFVAVAVGKRLYEAFRGRASRHRRHHEADAEGRDRRRGRT